MPPTRVIDLRDLPLACTECGEPLAIYEFYGDPSTLVCADCAVIDSAVAVGG